MIKNPDQVIESLKEEIILLRKILYFIIKKLGGVFIVRKDELVSLGLNTAFLEIKEEPKTFKYIIIANNTKEHNNKK